jgi:cysteinyl-tRNA synthetase
MKLLRHILFLIALSFLWRVAAQGQSLEDVQAWAYQLDAIRPTEIAANSTFHLMVMDYSADGTAENAFTAYQIAQIRDSGKIVLAYLSIGEAEDYRFYWNPDWKIRPPVWLGPENPDWPGNYKVRFWHSQWQKIVFSYLDTLLTKGFDGIYCDIVDAYAYWQEENPEEPRADSLMVQFLADIRQHIRTKTADRFFIFPQNAEEIIEGEHISPRLREMYWNTIDGIGVEDVFCPGNADENNPFAPDTERLLILQKFPEHGKLVLSVEYLTEPNRVQHYVTAARSAHFVPYVSTRNLDQLFNGMATRVAHPFISSPEHFVLLPNVPNPFNPVTQFRFFLPTSTEAQFDVYNAYGYRVFRRRWNGLSAGWHNFFWQAGSLPSGAYFYRLRTPRHSKSGKALLVK